jgi:hypothetical protein
MTEALAFYVELVTFEPGADPNARRTRSCLRS